MTVEELKAQYLKTGGVRCLYCQSPDIEGGPVQIDAGIAWQRVSCHGCAQTWTDVYHLAAVEVEAVEVTA